MIPDSVEMPAPVKIRIFLCWVIKSFKILMSSLFGGLCLGTQTICRDNSFTFCEIRLYILSLITQINILMLTSFSQEDLFIKLTMYN